MSGDQDGCEWVNVSSSTWVVLDKGRVKRLCVCVCVCVYLNVFDMVSSDLNKKSRLLKVLENR